MMIAKQDLSISRLVKTYSLLYNHSKGSYMKKLIIAGSSKLQERAAYWRGYFEGRGYEVIDFPVSVIEDDHYVENLTDIYCSYYQNLERADVFFLMNEDKDGIGGYIGPSAFSELSYVVVGNLNRGKRVEINLLQEPSDEQACYAEVKFWLDQGWVKIYDRPTGKKATIPVPAAPVADNEEEAEPIEDEADDTESEISEPVVATPRTHFTQPSKPERLINILTCRKRCLHHLDAKQREYLHTIAPEFPAWLLRYIATPEFQRLSQVGMVCGNEYSSIYNFETFHTTYAHSIGAALIVWRFTHDKRQTIAALFHDISTPAFKHTIDFMNNDSETQESIESRTSEIIRNSRAIMRQLKRDEIMAGEVSDYKLYPLADNELPGLAADRLEYSLSNGYFLFETWTLEDVARIANNITILKNENGIDELGFRDLAICKDYTKRNLELSANYHSDAARACDQFVADIIKSMILRDYLTIDDLYTMSEREIIDWILSCGDKTLSEAFRQYQRATSVYHSNTAKKDRYCASPKTKVRYIVPLVQGDAETGDKRVTELSNTISRAVLKYLETKQPKYVGFDFEFTPYVE